MSFLSRYWQAVERQHIETGMNHGDIYIDPTTIPKEKDTPVVNDVQPDVTPINPQPSNRPQQDGFMPRTTAEDLAVRFENNRRSARPDQRVQGISGKETKAAATGNNYNEAVDDERSRSKSGKQHQTKADRRKSDKQQKKALKKLGAGRNVRVRLSKVVIDGKEIVR